MSDLSVSFRLTGTEAVIEAFDQLTPKLQRKYLRRGLTKAARKIARAAKTNLKANRDSGALAASIGSKVGTKRNKAGVYAIVGPRRGYDRAVTGKSKAGTTRVAKRGVAMPAKVFRRPTRYAHLLEKGATRPKRGAMPALRWLSNAVDATKAAALADIQAAMNEGLNAEAARTNARSKAHK